MKSSTMRIIFLSLLSAPQFASADISVKANGVLRVNVEYSLCPPGAVCPYFVTLKNSVIAICKLSGQKYVRQSTVKLTLGNSAHTKIVLAPGEYLVNANLRNGIDKIAATPSCEVNPATRNFRCSTASTTVTSGKTARVLITCKNA